MIPVSKRKIIENQWQSVKYFFLKSSDLVGLYKIDVMHLTTLSAPQNSRLTWGRGFEVTKVIERGLELSSPMRRSLKRWMPGSLSAMTCKNLALLHIFSNLRLSIFLFLKSFSLNLLKEASGQIFSSELIVNLLPFWLWWVGGWVIVFSYVLGFLH